MQLTDDSEALTPSTIKLTHSLSETDINLSESDTDINTITNKTDTLTTPPHTKPYYSENEDEWQYKKDHIQNMISTSNSHPTTRKRKHKHIQRANSDLSTSLHTSYSKYSKKNKKITKAKLENINHKDLIDEYIRERKQRKKDKKQYKEMTRQFHETITKTADEYEDELTENKQQLKHEYEAKLIEAEIKRNEDEQRITQLNAQVQQLKTLLAMNTPSQKSHQSHQSLHSLDAELGPPLQIYQPINKTMSPLNHNNLHNNHTYTSHSTNTTPIATGPMSAQMMIHKHAFSFSTTIQNNQMQLDEGTSNKSVRSQLTNESNAISLMPNAQSMDQKLKMAMSPSLKYNHEYVGSFANIGTGDGDGNMYQGNEGVDEEENDMVIFDGYNVYQRNESDGSDTPEIVKRRRKKKKRKKKRKQEEESVWDFLIKCITPSVCENESV